MKRFVLLSVLALMTTSLAFPANLIGFGAQVNYASLNVAEPLKSAYGSGFGGGLHLDFRFGVATIRLNGDYISFGSDADAYRDAIYNQAIAENPGLAINKNDITVDGGRIGILSFGANGKFSMPQAAVAPYAIVGLGLATLSVSDLTVTYQGAPVSGFSRPPSTTKFMANAGIGVDFMLGPMALFAEVKYTWVFTDPDKSTYVPVTVGITF